MAQQNRARGRASKDLLPRERVQVDFAILGDFAQATNGKLTVVGAGWNLINAQQYPQILPFGLGIGILIPWGLTNEQHAFAFSIQDGNGNQVLGGGGQVEAGRQPGTPPGMSQRVVLGIAGQLQLGAPGTYVIIVTAAGDEKRITFEALPVQSVPPLQLGRG